MAGAAPYGEDLTLVVVGGGERQPVPNPLEPVQRKAAVPALPMAFSVRQWLASAVVTFRPNGEFHSPRWSGSKRRLTRPSFAICKYVFLIGFVPDQGVWRGASPT